MKKISILIADDHSLMRMGLKAMLNVQPDMVVTGEATNGREAVKLAAQLRPDIVIMDLMMPEIDGAEATRQIVSARTNTKVVILTSFANDAMLCKAIEYGAAGIQLKEDNEEKLLDTIKSVAAGEKKLPAQAKSPPGPIRNDPRLTQKQSDILLSVSRGLTNKDIARLFGITEVGVQKHLKLIFAKIGAANRAEAITLAIKKQLLKI